MVVTIDTFHLPRATTVADIAQTFRATAPKYQAVPGLLRKNYWLSEDGRRAGAIYVSAARADASSLHARMEGLRGWQIVDQ